MKKLYRSKDNKILTGVIGGIGEHYDIDPTILRLIFLALTIISGIVPGVVFYILAVVVVPKAPTVSEVVSEQ